MSSDSKIITYAVLDVFTNTPFTGNQLAVLTLTPAQSSTLTSAQKHAITREFNFSETIFIHPYDEVQQVRRVDIFTPQGEIPFAGHPIIGAVKYVLEHLNPEQQSETGACKLLLKAGIVTGRVDRNTGFASAEIPHDVHVHSVRLPWDRVVASQPALASSTSTTATAFTTSDGRIIIRNEMKQVQHHVTSICQGMNFALIDLSAQPELLDHVQVKDSYVATHEDLDQGWDEGLLGSVFFATTPTPREPREDGAVPAAAAEGDVVKINQRVIVINLEDPATGSASSALASFLALRRGASASAAAAAATTIGQKSERAAAVEGKNKFRFELEQGAKMGRKSIIGVEVTLGVGQDTIERVVLSGQSKLVMRGELYLD